MNFFKKNFKNPIFCKGNSLEFLANYYRFQNFPKICPNYFKFTFTLLLTFLPFFQDYLSQIYILF